MINEQYVILQEIFPYANNNVATVRCRYAQMWQFPQKFDHEFIFGWNKIIKDWNIQYSGRITYYLAIKYQSPLYEFFKTLQDSPYMTESVNKFKTAAPGILVGVLTGGISFLTKYKPKQVTEDDAQKWYNNFIYFLQNSGARLTDDLFFIRKEDMPRFEFSFLMRVSEIVEFFDISNADEQHEGVLKQYASYAKGEIGLLTGRAAFDNNAYCWFEMKGYWLPETKQKIGWVRETAINYDNMAAIQAWIEDQRKKLFPELYGKVKQKFSLKNILKYAAIAYGTYKLSGG